MAGLRWFPALLLSWGYAADGWFLPIVQTRFVGGYTPGWDEESLQDAVCDAGHGDGGRRSQTRRGEVKRWGHSK